MKVDLLYVVAFDARGETTQVTVGLFHKHAPHALNALGVYARADDNDDEAPGKLYRIPNLQKGAPPSLDTIATSANKTRNFKGEVSKAPKTNFTPVEVPEKRATVGMYLVCHGASYQDMGGEGEWTVRTIAPLLEIGGAPKIVCLVRCWGAPEDTAKLHGKPLPSQTTSDGIFIENMLVTFDELGYRPLITAWTSPISASPGKTVTQGTVPFGAKIVSADGQNRRPTMQDREKYKFGYYVNDEGKMMAIHAGAINPHYLS